MVVDRLADKLGAGPFRAKFKGEFCRGRQGAQELVLLKPLTFMNLSGESVRAALDFFKIEPAELVVVHDELDLPFGTIKVKFGGGTAGHNGLKSLVSQCGTPDFVRVRIGIGRPRSGVAHGHVLGDFSADESAQLEDVLERASAAVADIPVVGVSEAMNRHNRSST
jgi:PTH1 family peptidyl-tRNA hydrolase